MQNQKSVLEMARGAIMERVDYEMNNVIANILDLNTKATDQREITITVKLKPDDERSTIAVSAVAKSKLAPTNPIATALYVAKDRNTGELQAVEMVPQIPGQMGTDGYEQEDAPYLKLSAGGNK